MDPLTLRIVVVGGILVVAGLGADLSLELTGHGSSAALPVILKMVTLGISILTSILAGAAGVGPRPAKSLRDLLRPKLPASPAPAAPSAPQKPLSS